MWEVECTDEFEQWWTGRIITMTGRSKFSELKKQMGSERVSKSEAKTKTMLAEMLLPETLNPRLQFSITSNAVSSLTPSQRSQELNS